MSSVDPSSFANFGELLKYLRQHARLTQRQLGVAVGNSEAQVNRLEGGQRLPDPVAVRARFIEALELQHEPALAAQLISLAEGARQISTEVQVVVLPYANAPSAAKPGSSAFRLQMLGDFTLFVDGKPLTGVNTARLQSFLAYLALHRDAPQSRQQVAFLFWPDSVESLAHNNLRQLLHQYRQVLRGAGHLILVDTNTVQLNPDTNVTLDVADFLHALARAGDAGSRSDKPVAQAELETAVHLYHGDLLPGCYDDWVVPERERLRGLYAGALERLAQLLEDERNYGLAIQHTRQLLRLDSLGEGAHLRLMRLHALNDDRASALRAYHTCVTTLQQELGAAPGAAIREAYARLLSTDAGDLTASAIAADTRATALFVGRQPEWQALRDVWRDAQDGRPRFVLIACEAGIGKSRLAEEMLRWAAQQGVAVAKTRAYAAEGRLAFAPVAEWLRSEAIRPALAGLDALWLTEVARVVPELLVERPDLLRPEPLAEYGQRQRFFEALARAVTGTARPLMLLLDDLQWCDAETLEWLHYLLRLRAGAALLVIGTARSEEVDTSHPLTQLVMALRATDQFTEITLQPLDATETSRLAVSIVGHELSVEEVLRLFRDTEGYPLFIVEAARASTAPAEPATSGKNAAKGVLPPKVYAVVAGRLSQLTPATRELAALAATIGRAFTFDVLSTASDLDERELVRALDELWRRRIVREQVALAYDFSHDKLREVAYAEMSPAQRVKLHRRVARAMEGIFVADLDQVAAQLAAHYELAGMEAQAIPYCQQAAAVAQRVFAHDEAIHLLHKGLALLLMLPQSQTRDERELDMQMALGTSLVTMWGYGAPDVMEVCSRALTLCERLGRPPSPPTLRALVIANISHVDFQRAHDVASQLLALAEQRQDRVLIVEGHYSLGVVLFYRGECALSRAHLDQALAHYDARLAPTHIALYTQDPKVVCLNRLSLDLWCLGYPDQAAMRTQAASAAALALSHPFSTGYHLGWDIVLQCVRQDTQATQAQAEALIALGREHRLGQWLPMGLALHGWATALLGAVEAGMAELQQGIAVFRAAGSQQLGPFFFALLADLHARSNHIDQSLSLLSEGLTVTDRSGEYWYAAELHRRKGELLLLRGDVVGAEDAFERALDVARAQQARSFELRAATRLAQLWKSLGRRAEAYRLLSPIYHWFSEGYNTPDLLAASNLLELLREH